MYTTTSKTIATAVIALALLAAAPVFADSDHSIKGNNGLHLGVFAKLLSDDRAEAKEERKADRKDQRATSTRTFVIEGTITAVSGTTLTLQGKKGAIYTVNAANASVTGHENVALTLAALAVQDKIKVTGSLSGSTVVATKIKDKSDTHDTMFRTLKAGTVAAINGATVTLSNFGSAGATIVTTNAATKYSVNGAATSSSALSVGSHVLILGTTGAASSTSMNASLIVILTDGMKWLMRFWN